jgi:hypothetical protein
MKKKEVGILMERDDNNDDDEEEEGIYFPILANEHKVDDSDLTIPTINQENNDTRTSISTKLRK